MGLDAAILAATPLTAASLSGHNDHPMGLAGYIVGKGGLYLQASSKVMHAIRRVGDVIPQVTIPYGDVEETTVLFNGPIPARLMAEATEMARRACPNEWAGWIYWDSVQERYRLWTVEAENCLDVSSCRIRYRMPAHISPDTVVVDLHSHGRGGAYFSATDDADDRMWPGPCVLSGVIGRCGTGQSVEITTRVVLNGSFWPLQ